MKEELEQNIQSVLDAALLLRPISVRVVLNRNAGREKNEDLVLWYEGSTSAVFEETDSKFYSVMKSQNMIQIPSIAHSMLLGNLGIGDASAIFYPIKTKFGYCGFMWGCFEPAVLTEKAQTQFISFCRWLNVLLQNEQEKELSYQSISDSYADVLESIRVPALVMIRPDQLLISNPRFESLKERDEILEKLHIHGADEQICHELQQRYGCVVKELNFSDEKNGTLMIFLQDRSNPSLSPDFVEKELEYYKLLVQKARDNISMMDSVCDLTDLQKSYVQKADVPLRRMDRIFGYSVSHCRSLLNGKADFSAVSVIDMVQDVVMDLASQARNRHVEVDFSSKRAPDGRSNGSAFGDSRLLTLTVYCLIDNAIRLSRPDGKHVTVQLTFNEKDWRLQVEDFGIGIAPLDLERIREEDCGDEAGNVRGIGLIRYTTRLHGGTFTVESALGKGSLFTLNIPYYKSV